MGATKGSNVTVVHNFVDLDAFSTDSFSRSLEKKKLGLDQGRRVVVCISNLSQRKGTREVVRSLAFLDDDVSIVMVGISNDDLVDSGPHTYAREVIADLDNLDYSSRTQIIWAGTHEDVRPFLAAADVLIAPWMKPHFARPIFEAWAMRRPVIAFAVAGIKGVVEDGVDGVLVHEKTGQHLAVAINDVVHDEDRLAYLAENGYNKAREQFSQSTNTKRIDEIYHDLITHRE